MKFAERVSLSLSPGKARVRQLEKACVIRGYVALLDPENVGPTLNVFIEVTLNRRSEAVIESLEKAMSDLPEVWNAT